MGPHMRRCSISEVQSENCVMQINMWIGIYVEECLKQRLSTVPTAFATKNSLPTASSVQSETQALDKQSYFEPVLYNHHQRSCHWTII